METRVIELEALCKFYFHAKLVDKFCNESRLNRAA